MLSLLLPQARYTTNPFRPAHLWHKRFRGIDTPTLRILDYLRLKIQKP